VIHPSKAKAIDNIGAKNKAVPAAPRLLSKKPTSGVVVSTAAGPESKPETPIIINGIILMIVEDAAK